MSNVVSLTDRKSGPHLSGPARCVRCKHEWQAVTPEGVFKGLECPECGNFSGVRWGLIGPEHEYWQCICGCATFALSRTGAPICVNCGVRATSWADG
jgi:hypothetical protein